MVWISFRALPCRKKRTWWQLASRCCWNQARPWHASELVSFLVGQRTYQHPGSIKCNSKVWCEGTSRIELARNKFHCNIFLHEIRKRKTNWIGHILRRNCLLQQVIEGKIKGQIEVTRRWGRRRKELLDDLKHRRGYCQLKEEALDRTVWRNRFGRGFGPVVWQITDDDDDEPLL